MKRIHSLDMKRISLFPLQSLSKPSVLHRNRRILDLLDFPSGYAFQLSIRDRSHPTRNTLHVGTFGFTAEWFLTILFVTHVNILTSDRSGFSPRNLTDFLLLALQNVLLPCLQSFRFEHNHRFGFILSLLYLWRKIPPLVRCYAFFNGWLLPSPPPSCHWNFTSFRTEYEIGDLID